MTLGALTAEGVLRRLSLSDELLLDGLTWLDDNVVERQASSLMRRTTARRQEERVASAALHITWHTHTLNTRCASLALHGIYQHTLSTQRNKVMAFSLTRRSR